MLLDRVQQHGPRLPVTGDRQVEHSVAAGVAVELFELVQIERDRLRLDAGAIDNGRYAACAAE